MELPFFIQNTGGGTTTQFSHRVFAALDGTLFPVVAKIWKGYVTGRACYQAVPCETSYARIWATGSANPNVGWESGIEFFAADGQSMTEAEALARGATLPALRKVLAEVKDWQNGRTCHWPPGRNAVEPADLGLLEIAFAIQSAKEAAELVQTVWDLFPRSAEWHAVVGTGEALEQRGLVIVPGLEGRWRYHQPPINLERWENPRTEFAIAHHHISFDSPIYILAGDETSLAPDEAGFWKGIGWAPNDARITVRDKRFGSEVAGSVHGIFWVRHWPPDGRD